MQADRTSGQASTFSIPLVDASGAPIAGTAASWELRDERGAVIDAGVVADFDPAVPTATFEIEADALTLPAGKVSQGREIVVAVTTATGEAEVRDYFILVEPRPLVVMINSFISYPEALSIRQSFGPVLTGWDTATQISSRASALADAHERLLRMSYKVPFVDGMERASSYAAYGTGTDEPFDTTRRVRLRNMSVEEFDSLPVAFLRAIKRAQLIEANVILGGDVVGRKRQDGIISETIGESSATFSDKPFLNLPISRQAYEELRRYIVIRIGVARG